MSGNVRKWQEMVMRVMIDENEDEYEDDDDNDDDDDDDESNRMAL